MFQHCRGSREQVNTVTHVDDDLGVAVSRAATGVANQHQRVGVVAMADDGGGLPGNVHRGILQEVVFVQGFPDSVDLFVRHVLGVENLPRLGLGGAYPFLTVYRCFRAAPECPFGLDVELAQQRGAPGVPQLGIGGADIAHRQHVEVVQVHLAGNGACEPMDDVRIGDVLALGGHRHQQVIFHQPGGQLGVPFTEVVAFAEVLDVNCAQLRVVAAPAFGHVMIKAGNIQCFQLR